MSSHDLWQEAAALLKQLLSTDPQQHPQQSQLAGRLSTCSQQLLTTSWVELELLSTVINDLEASAAAHADLASCAHLTCVPCVLHRCRQLNPQQHGAHHYTNSWQYSE